MRDARELLAAYLEQMRECGEEQVILDAALPSDAGPAEPLTPSEPQATAEQPDPTSPPPQPTAVPPYRPTAPGRAGRKGKKDWRDGAPPIPGPGMAIAPPSSDLFSADPLAHCGLDEIAARVRECAKCRLSGNRTNAVPGEGPSDAKLVVVGEGPGATEDETGRPFVGRAGELLTEILQAIDLPRERVFICNVVKCRPPSNRKPLQDEIDACVPYLYRQLESIGPKVIVAMGGTAAETLLSSKRSLASLRNRVHSFRGMPLIVTYHPAALLRNPNWKKPAWDDIRIARQLVDH